MNELQVFKFENNQVRTVLINDEPYFVGKDVAGILGYQNPSKALADHVDEDDKLNNDTLSSLGQRGGWLINESGLYTLVLSSKLPGAKKFKRWVTKEVLPTIRKTGGYKVPDNPMDALKLMFEAQTQTNQQVGALDKRVTDLEDNKLLDPGEYNYISRAVKRKVKEVMCELNIDLISKQKSQIYHAINRDLNCFIGIKTRTQFKAKDFDRALEFIQNWQLSYTDKKIIEQLSIEVEQSVKRTLKINCYITFGKQK